MKVAELEGALLAGWVARANGWPVEIEDPDEPESPLYCRDERGVPWSFTEHGYWPQVKWDQGGPIIEREIAHLTRHGPARWSALANGSASGHGPTPLIAAMRAYVASKFGDEVAEGDTP